MIDTDLFESLGNDINHFQSLGTVMLAGDFNARTACKCDAILCDSYVHNIDPDYYLADNTLPRFSMDKGSNSQGNNLLDLCMATTLRIANRRLGSDYSIGKYTCFNIHGASVIDCLILRLYSFNIVDNLIMPRCLLI